ncbi:bifunctional PTS system fructose-specific transporter subunit IIA/HPr protein [Vibrio sp. qd031]|uniref:fused PTS fructose transporter subunit IIA/HPr protein n=1 Tax=Vibrio sp. qd031 TaxID=1603038 RepID=UPI000A111A4F|nr:fused PTS fructose transporter subunit IIA/HPr protein [Vibrio sp. qd031]ORT48619.1 bifunctional PTS system fructose-specific transporter subunit IIA/HPr protein [Vibrio sp. qd031]
MLKLSTSDIKLNQAAVQKQEAITALAKDLAGKQLVDEKYLEGMLNREAQNSTFLGNGIAIPHGTTETRGLVQKTGVAVHHFPAGVDWGNGNTVYVAIGIAAKSDEHLGILKALTKVLSDDQVEAKLQSATTEADIAALLNGEVQLTAEFEAALIQHDFPVTDMIPLSAVVSGLIKNSGAANTDFVTEIVAKTPTSLGNGLWLVSGTRGVTRTAISFVSAATPFDYEGKPVKALLAIAACNMSHQRVLDIIGQHIAEGRQTAIAEATPQELLALFSPDSEVAVSSTSTNQAVFKIKNAHGLHARPGAMLVAAAKKFDATIKVANLNGDAKLVNAKSLMKVIGMGVTQGHELKFVADGPDAKEALAAIGAAIDAGLGEG